MSDPAGGDLIKGAAVVHLRAKSLGIGDVNGDGQADLIVGGARSETADDLQEVRVFFGPLAPDVYPSDADRVWFGDEPRQRSVMEGPLDELLATQRARREVA